MRSCLLLLVGAAVVFAAAGAVGARAATITDDVKFSATVPAVQTPPVDPVVGDFTITFDPTLDYVNETVGITGKSLNIALDSALAFSYSTNDGILRVGGIENGVSQIAGFTNDFFLDIGDISTTPLFFGLSYVQGTNQIFESDRTDGSVDVTPVPPGVPEPSTWAMMLIGFAVLGYVGYRRATARRLAGTPSADRRNGHSDTRVPSRPCGGENVVD
jgi:PEP-CTERM motif